MLLYVLQGTHSDNTISLIYYQAAHALSRSNLRSIAADPSSPVDQHSEADSTPIMVTGTYAFPRGYPNHSTTWLASFQNSYSTAPTAPRPQSQGELACDTCYAASSHPTLASPEVSGYLHSHGKARDDYKGKYLEYVLQAKDIDIETAPPFQPVTDKVGYANHGVIKINNVST